MTNMIQYFCIDKIELQLIFSPKQWKENVIFFLSKICCAHTEQHNKQYPSTLADAPLSKICTLGYKQIMLMGPPINDFENDMHRKLQ